MKVFLVLTTLLSIHSAAFAGTHACEKLAVTKATEDVEEQVADDCFVRFVQPGKDNADLIHVGISCDHSESYIYQVLTAPQGKACSILKMKTFPTERAL